MTTINWNKIYPYENTLQTWSSICCSSNGSIVYACEANGVAGSRLYKSIDYGDTWVAQTLPSGANVGNTVKCTADGLYAVTGNIGSVYADVYINAPWANSSISTPLQIYAISCDRNYSSTPYVWLGRFDASSGTDISVLRSTDGGAGYSSIAVFGVNTYCSSIASAYANGKYYAIMTTIFGTIKSYDTSIASPYLTTITLDGYTFEAGISLKFFISDDTSLILAEDYSSNRVFVSNDKGVSWQEKTASNTRQQYFVNSTGNIILRRSSNTTIERSIDRGNTWTTLTAINFNSFFDAEVYRLTASDDGVIIYVTTNSGNLYKSLDSGNTWAEIAVKTYATTYNWNCAATSRDNNFLIGGIRPPDPFDINTNYNQAALYYSLNSGSTWARYRPAYNLTWNSVSLDRNNLNIVASCSLGRIYFSTNSGTSWAEHNVSQAVDKNWVNVSMSSDGSIFFACDTIGRVYKATNVNTYEEVQPNGNNVFEWSCVKLSSGGNYVIATQQNGRVYLSSNIGVSWTEIRPKDNNNYDWSTASINSNGSCIIVGQKGGRLYMSKDTGATWAEVTPLGLVDLDWNDSFMNDTGDIIFVSDATGKYYSKDYGETWEATTNTGAYDTTCVSGNNNGLRLVMTDGYDFYKGDSVNVKNASFLQDLII